MLRLIAEAVKIFVELTSGIHSMIFTILSIHKSDMYLFVGFTKLFVPRCGI